MWFWKAWARNPLQADASLFACFIPAAVIRRGRYSYYFEGKYKNMWANQNGVFNDFTKGILAQYRRYLELDLSTPIGFDGVTASQRLTVFTPVVDSDALLFGGSIDFAPLLVTVKITDTASGYVWNPRSFTPIGALCGTSTQVSPVLGLTVPFFLARNSTLQMDFVNSPTGTLVTAGNITWRGVKLLQ